MPYSAPAQFPLAHASPIAADACATTLFEVTLGTDGKRISLVMQQQGAAHPNHITITRDTRITIVLNGDQLFFSKRYDAVTMKAELAYFYGGLEYDGYDPALDRYKSVSFSARFNRCGKYGTIHPFNLNVDLLQDSATGNPAWIPLTIDPDIKNPPPV